MYKVITRLLIISLPLTQLLKAQTIFLNSSKGDERNKGTVQSPVASFDAAMNLAASFSRKENITIKVQPELYILMDKIILFIHIF